VYARVLTFHVDDEHLPLVRDALDVAMVRWREQGGFQGLLCMEHDGLREQVMLITLWDTRGLATTAHQAEEARELISDATDAGVSSCTYEILGFVPGCRRVSARAPAGPGDAAGAPARQAR